MVNGQWVAKALKNREDGAGFYAQQGEGEQVVRMHWREGTKDAKTRPFSSESPFKIVKKKELVTLRTDRSRTTTV